MTPRCGSSPTSSARDVRRRAPHREVVLVEAGSALRRGPITGRSCTWCCRHAARRARPRRPGHATCGPTPTPKRWSRSGGRCSCTSRPRTPPSVRRAAAQGGARRRDPADADVRAVPQGVRRVGGRSQPLPDGGLLPRPAPPLRRADGRRQTRRRQVELRRRQPRTAAEKASRTLDVPKPYQPTEDDIDEQVRARPRPHGPAARSAATARGCSPSPPTEAQRALERFVEHRLPTSAARGRDHGPGLGDVALAAVGAAQPRCAAPARRRASRRGRLPTARRCRSPRAEGFIRQVLGWREYMWHLYWHFGPGYTRRNALRGAHAAAGLVARTRRRRRHRRVPAPRAGGRARPRLDPPHPAADGAGQPRAAARLSALGAVGVVRDRLRRRVRVGDADQRHRDEPARRRRHAGHQAVRLGRRLHQQDERPLRRLRVRPEEATRRRRLPVHGGLLGVRAPPPGSSREEQPHAARRRRRWSGSRTSTPCSSRSRHAARF